MRYVLFIRRIANVVAMVGKKVEKILKEKQVVLTCCTLNCSTRIIEIFEEFLK